MVTQGVGVGQGGLDLGLRPVTLDLMRPIMIFLLWTLTGSDQTLRGAVSGHAVVRPVSVCWLHWSVRADVVAQHYVMASCVRSLLDRWHRVT
jgi:hypothetical protein